MTDIPDDLTDVGVHHGNEPPPETGQTVRSPEGPTPSGAEAQPSPGLFQVIRPSAEDRIKVEVYPARAEVPPPEEGEEVGRYRTVKALRAALADDGIDGRAAVFEDAEVGRLLVENTVNAEHAWIGQPRYPTITFFPTAEDARAFAEGHSA